MGSAKRVGLSVVLGCAVLWGADLVLAGASTGRHWAYKGAIGPENWGALSEDFAACNGDQQSPIDITKAIKAEIGKLSPQWAKPFAATVRTNRFGIKANVTSRGHLKMGNSKFKLKEFHFHAPSEHTVNGRHYPMEAHFVHQAEDGRLLVVGIFLKKGEINPAFEHVWLAALGEGQVDSDGRGSMVKGLEPADFLPKERSFLRYEGSLTTPPCSEKVTWLLFKNPVEMAPEQIYAFTRSYEASARPTQPLHRRFVLYSD